MHAFDILGDPVLAPVFEVLADGEHPSGAVVEVIQREFGITQSAVSQHLKVLRESGFASVRADGSRRLYSDAARVAASRSTRGCNGSEALGAETRSPGHRGGPRKTQTAADEQQCLITPSRGGSGSGLVCSC